MSAKQAKRLRKAAMGLVVAVTEAGKEVRPRQLMAQEHRRAAPPAPPVADETSQESSVFMNVHPKERVDDPAEKPRGELFAITAVNRPDSLRGIIRNIKKGMKNGTIGKLPPQQRA